MTTTCHVIKRIRQRVAEQSLQNQRDTLCMLGPEAYRELMANIDEWRLNHYLGMRIVNVQREGVWFE